MSTDTKKLKALGTGLTWPKFISAYKKAYGKTTHEELSSLWIKYKEINNISPKTTPKGKAPAKKSPAKKPSPKREKKKSPPRKKKSPAKKVAEEKKPSPKKKSPAKKVSPKKKSPAKKKSPVKKAAAKKKAQLEIVPVISKENPEIFASSYLLSPGLKPENGIAVYLGESDIPKTWLVIELPIVFEVEGVESELTLDEDVIEGLRDFSERFTTNKKNNSFNISYFEIDGNILRLYVYVIDLTPAKVTKIRDSIVKTLSSNKDIISETQYGTIYATDLSFGPVGIRNLRETKEPVHFVKSKKSPPKAPKRPTTLLELIGPEHPKHSDNSKDNFKQVLDAIEKNEYNTSTFTDLVLASGLANEHFSSPTYGKSVTIYVPTNDAFNNFPKDALDYILEHPKELIKVLRNHIIWRATEDKDVRVTVDYLNIPKGVTSYDYANVIKRGNGDYYLIDNVVLPYDLVIPSSTKKSPVKPLVQSPPIRTPKSKSKSPKKRNNTPADISPQNILGPLAYFLRPALVPDDGYGLYGDTFYESDLPNDWFVVRVPLTLDNEPYHGTITGDDVDLVTEYIRNLRREEYADQFNIYFWDWNQADGVIRLYCVIYEGSNPIQVRNEIYAAIDEDRNIFNDVYIAITQDAFDADLGKPVDFNNLPEEETLSFGDINEEEPDLSARNIRNQSPAAEISPLTAETEPHFTSKKGIHCPNCHYVGLKGGEKTIDDALVIKLELDESPSLGNKNIIPLTSPLTKKELTQIDAAMTAINKRIASGFYIQYFSYDPNNNYIKLYIQGLDTLTVDELETELASLTNGRPIASEGKRAVRLGPQVE